jgi:hypothetical protein
MNTTQLNGFGRPVATPEKPRRTIPFDYAFRFDLTGEPGRVLNSTVEVSIEADFTAVSIGYGVVPTAQPIVFGLSAPPPGTTRPPINLFFTPLSEIIETLSTEFDEDVTFPNPVIFATSALAAPLHRKVQFGPKTAAVLKGGLRLNPEFAERIFLTGGDSDRLDEKILQEAFQAVGAPAAQIAFLYAIFDEGSGREFQSDPILSIAGLGSPDGKRPFRYFAQPIELPARSVIRMEITEVSAFKGELHISLQGYKTLGQPGTPTGTAQRHHRRMRR